MSQEQKAGQNQSIKSDNHTEMLEQFKYLGTNLTKQIYIQEEIKSRLKSENACIIRFRTFCLPRCYPKI